MTPRGRTPLSAQRQLRVALRAARDKLTLTQKDVAEALEWSTSKLIRIENGSVGISITDLKALLLHYRTTDAVEVEQMVELARAAKKDTWWQGYGKHHPQQFITFLGFEASATRIRQFQGLLVPGLLQSSGYARVLTAIGAANQESARRSHEIRMKRQDLISDDGPEMFFIIDESVLYRRIGDFSVMREQLLVLKERAGHPNLSVQFLPYSAGVHKGMKGSFEIFEMSNEPDDYALLLEQPYKDVLLSHSSEETKEYVNIFFELEKIALPAAETPRIIDERLSQMGKEG